MPGAALLLRAVEPTLGRLTVALIRGYQCYLSPYKGYACAHRVRYGGESCSEYGRRVFSEQCWHAALRSLRARFRACHAARWSRSGELLHAGVGDEYLDGPSSTGMKTSSPGGAGWVTEGCARECGEWCIVGSAEACTNILGNWCADASVEACGSVSVEACGSALGEGCFSSVSCS